MKILIADDEILVRRSILMYLTDLGIKQKYISEAGDGFSLVEAMEHQHFDLALVDIRMPGMDGLEAVRKARLAAPKTDFYILSGFDDFKYAQEAIRLGVKDYILKPIKMLELEKIIENTISALEQDRMQLCERLHFTTAALLNIPDYSVRLPAPCHPVLVANNVPSEPFSLTELISDEDDRIIVTAHPSGNLVLLFFFELQEYPGYYGEYLSGLVKRCHTKYTLVEGKTFLDSQDWKNDYERMQLLTRLRPILGSRRLFPCSCKVPTKDEALYSLCRCCESCMDTYSDSDYAGFLISCGHLVKAMNTIIQTHPACAKNVMRFLSHAFGLKDCSFDGLKNQLLMAAATLPALPRDFKYDEITAYIQTHYMEDLSLSDLAAMYGLSPNYFSTLFKKKAGCNFIHYLTNLRISQSKRLLLETNMTIREVAQNVGYYSTSFFIRSFKKSELVTPSEYRRQA